MNSYSILIRAVRTNVMLTAAVTREKYNGIVLVNVPIQTYRL